MNTLSRCAICGGSGKTKNPNHEGQPYMPYPADCRSCKGSGWVLIPTVPTCVPGEPTRPVQYEENFHCPPDGKPTPPPTSTPDTEWAGTFDTLRKSLVECVAYLDRMGQDGVRERAYKALALPMPLIPDASAARTEADLWQRKYEQAVEEVGEWRERFGAKEGETPKRCRELWQTALDEQDALREEVGRLKADKARDSARLEGGELLSLIDGAKSVVEIWQPSTPAQIKWKEEWLKNARAQIAAAMRPTPPKATEGVIHCRGDGSLSSDNA